MIKYTNNLKNKMKRFVVDNLVANYHYSYTESRKIVEESTFNQLLEEETEYVFHYSVSYWTKAVKEEYESLLV